MFRSVLQLSQRYKMRSRAGDEEESDIDDGKGSVSEEGVGKKAYPDAEGVL